MAQPSPSLFTKSQLCTQLFVSFLKISPTTFGGGYAILPVIQREITEHRGWISDSEMNELTAIAGASPGGIGINIAALIGYRIAGIQGLLSAVIAISLPTVAFMLLLSSLAAGYSNHPIVKAALLGIQPAIIALIAFAAIRMRKDVLRTPAAWMVFGACVFLLFWTSLHPVVVIGCGVAAGFMGQLFRWKHTIQANSTIHSDSTR